MFSLAPNDEAIPSPPRLHYIQANELPSDPSWFVPIAECAGELAANVKQCYTAIKTRSDGAEN